MFAPFVAALRRVLAGTVAFGRVTFDAIAPPPPGPVAPFDRRFCGRVPSAEAACGPRSRGVPEGARRAASDRPPASLVIAPEYRFGVWDLRSSPMVPTHPDPTVPIQRRSPTP